MIDYVVDMGYYIEPLPITSILDGPATKIHCAPRRYESWTLCLINLLSRDRRTRSVPGHFVKDDPACVS